MIKSLSDILSAPGVRDLIARAVEEDVGSGDVTSEVLVPEEVNATGRILSRERCVVAGVSIARAVFQYVDPDLDVQIVADNGAVVEPNGTLMTIKGKALSILTAERVALNFLQRMAGIATLTESYAVKAKAFGVQILDTRKTTPGLRALEKHAVLCGGGSNHRMGLFDRVMIKDNHVALWQQKGGATMADAVRLARKRNPDLLVEVEVESMEALVDVLEASPDWVLLDNMSPAEMTRCVETVAGRCKLEASGGITMDTLDQVLATGVDAISLGTLTHSARSIDLSLELEW